MMNLRFWLSQQELSVRELALQIDVPLKTVQDWVYRGREPSLANRERLVEFVHCTHHWVIERSNGPVSDGVCQRCGEKREFMNSQGHVNPWSKERSFALKYGATTPHGNN